MTEHEEEVYSFGEWVQKCRKRLYLTQKALAQRVGCAEVTLRKIEADTMRPSRETAERLALCLDIPTSERSIFVESARGERSVDRLGSPRTAINIKRPLLPVPPPIPPLIVTQPIAAQAELVPGED